MCLANREGFLEEGTSEPALERDRKEAEARQKVQRISGAAGRWAARMPRPEGVGRPAG